MSRDILTGRTLTQDDAVQSDDEPSAESERQIEWRHLESLEDRLRAINDAQDRLLDGEKRPNLFARRADGTEDRADRKEQDLVGKCEGSTRRGH